ncbi:MAG: sulfurtransferase [Deltaproteobacteria bacterium]|nr:sulfurtransferase [Deltaproteobacteria bacterium]
MKQNMKLKFSVLIAVTVMVASTSVFAKHAKHTKHAKHARHIDPIVSTDWLAANQADVVVLDVRSADAYAAGHIPGAISAPWVVPFSAWITMSPEGLLLEMPTDADLVAAIGDLGIARHTKVVVVGAPNAGEPVYYGPAGAVRVALTLSYAGVKHVAVLDGGQPKWVVEGRAITTEASEATPVVFKSKIDHDMIATIDEVAELIAVEGVTLMDARDAEVYAGDVIEPFAPAPGHIPTAYSLPTPAAFDVDGDVVTFKDVDILEEMAFDIILNSPAGDDVEIVYCGVGGYGAVWTYLLRQVLGEKKVKLFDGSAQEWVALGYEMSLE